VLCSLSLPLRPFYYFIWSTSEIKPDVIFYFRRPKPFFS
jgi:hypothetical protein